ncbi:uncharacterized protein LOC129225708 [Uloborus diversus]|uniref:uncharacterized protein LOC129225708 n=1 Tax=Uloborus diversus TaxID=327109 RepID=UPI00240A22FC|nr:uncharacterized protein LOC129225708 [Uloborus diversus]
MMAREKAILMKTKKRNDNSKPISLFAAPYFRDGRGRVPAANEDTMGKRKTCPVDAYLMAPKPWLAAESQKLMDGVADSVLNEALKPYKLRRDHLRNKLKDVNLPEFEEPVIQLELENIEYEIEKLQ